MANMINDNATNTSAGATLFGKYIDKPHTMEKASELRTEK